MKQKSHTGAKKRIKITARGRVMFKKPCKNHLLFNKSKRQKRSFRKGVAANNSDVPKIKSLLPNYL